MTDPDTRHRPLVSGIAISTGKTDSEGKFEQLVHGCTFTGLATRVSDNEKVLVTNRHCIDDERLNPVGHIDLYQGALSSPSKSADKVGVNLEYEPANLYAENEVDVAYWELHDTVDAEFKLHQTKTTTPADRKIIAGEVTLERNMMLTMIGRKGGEGQVRVRAFGLKHKVDDLDYENVILLDCAQRPAIPGDSGSGLFYKIQEGVYQLAGIFFAGRKNSQRSDWGLAFPAKTAEEKLGIVFGNRIPVADAGPAQSVKAGALVTLDPRGSFDDDGDDLTWSWEQLDVDEDDKVALSTVTNLDGRRTFTAPAGPTSLSFRVTVKDEHGGEDTATTTVDVSTNPPDVDAGEDQTDVKSRHPVALRATDSNGRARTWKWEQLPGGPRVRLNHPTSRYSWFTAPGGACSLRFRVTGTDRYGSQDADDVTVVIKNQPPTARVGGTQTVSRRARVALTGSGTDPDADDNLTFKWVQKTGTTVELTDADSKYATFTAPDRTGGLTFDFTVTDNHGASDTKTDTVRVR